MDDQRMPKCRLSVWGRFTLLIFALAFVASGVFGYFQHQELEQLKLEQREQDLALKATRSSTLDLLAAVSQDLHEKLDAVEQELYRVETAQKNALSEFATAQKDALVERDQKIQGLETRELENREKLEKLTSLPTDLKTLGGQFEDFRQEMESVTINVPALFEKSKCGVVELLHEDFPGDQTTGSGFFIGEGSKYIALAWHEVDGIPIEKLAVRFCDGATSKILRIAAKEPPQEAAILELRTPRPDLQPLPLAQTVLNGEPAFGIGYMKKYEYSIFAGRISAVRREGKKYAWKTFSEGEPADLCAACTKVLQLDATIYLGSSGGPVLNNRGEVLGVVSLRDGTGIGFLVSFEVLRELLRSIEEQKN